MFYWIVGAMVLGAVAKLTFYAAVIYVIVKIIGWLTRSVMNLIPGQKEKREFKKYMDSLEKSFKFAEKMDKKSKAKKPITASEEKKLEDHMNNITFQCKNVQSFLLRPVNQHVWERMDKKQKEHMMSIFSVGLKKNEVKLKLK